MTFPLVLAAVGACSGPDDTDPVASPEHGLVVATSDFSVGALATIDPVAGTLQDTLVTTAGDAAVTADAGFVFQIDRSPPAAVRAWAAPDWSQPVAEFALPGGSNPQDVAVCAERVFVSVLAEPRVYVFDLDGTPTATVDLTAWADDDGSPEAATLVRLDERLFVGLQRLDTRGAQWLPAGDGEVVAIDCADATVGASWSVGPNPSVHAGHAGLLVRTGIWGEADGALVALDTTTGTTTPYVTEPSLGRDLSEVVVVGDHLLAITAAFDFADHALWCRGPSGDTTSEPVGNYLSAIAPFEDGAWVAQSIDYADSAAATGAVPFDAATCSFAGEPLRTLLPPYAIAAY